MDISFLRLYVGRYCSPLLPCISSVNWFTSWIWQKAMQSFCLVIFCQISVLWKGLKNAGAGRSGWSVQSGKGPSLNQLTLLQTHSLSITVTMEIKFCPDGHFSTMSAKNLTFLVYGLWLLFTFWHTQLKECMLLYEAFLFISELVSCSAPMWMSSGK